MQAGLIATWALLELSVSVSGTVARTNTSLGARARGGLQTKYTPNSSLLQEGITLEVYTQLGGAGPFGVNDEHVYNLDIVGLPGALYSNSVVVAGWAGSVSSRVEMDDVALYRLPGDGWQLTVGQLRWYRDGATLIDTIGPFTLYNLLAFTPAGIPLLGIPAEVGAMATFDQAPASGLPYVGTASTDDRIYATATGGWRFKETLAGGWQTPPVNLAALGPPAIGGCLSPTVGAVTATNTYDLEATAGTEWVFDFAHDGSFECDECSNGPAVPPAIFDVTTHHLEYRIWAAGATLLPDLPKSVGRLNGDDGDDYAALIVRGGTPQAYKTASNVCISWSTDDCLPDTDHTTETVTEETHASRPELLSTVLNATHVIEDPFSEATAAPYGLSGFLQQSDKTEYTLVSPGGCPASMPGDPPGEIIVCFDTQCHYDDSGVSSFHPTVEDSGSNGALLSYLDHPDHTARYVNYCASPHWSYFYWWPPDIEDEEEPLHDYEWPVYGSRANPRDYWKPLGHQYLHHPALPTNEKRRTRNFLVTAAAPTYWWGITRFKTSDPTTDTTSDPYAQMPVSLALDATSAPAWSFEDCGAVFGSDIVLTPGAQDIVAEVDLGRFSERPYLYPHICKHLGASYVAANVASIRIYLVNVQGEKYLMETISTGQDRPTADDGYYAGAWAQDWGCAFLDDTGFDLQGSGISAASMADPERVLALQLLGGWGAARLRYEISVADLGQPVTIHYPTFQVQTEGQIVVPENAHVFARLYPDGPGLRSGQWDWWDPFANVLLDVPMVRPVYGQWTVLDALIEKRLLLLAQGKTWNLDAEIATLYDATEGQARLDLTLDTYALVLDDVLHSPSPPDPRPSNRAGRYLYVNALAEVPPLATFPFRARDGSLGATGVWAQEAWSLAQESRHLISAGEAQHLREPGAGGTRWTALTTNPDLLVSGWPITSHRHAVNNNEGPTFLVERDGKPDIASAAPWHGYLLVFTRTLRGSSPWNLGHPWGRYHRVQLRNGNVYYDRSDFGVPRPYAITNVQVTDSGRDTDPRLIEDYRGLVRIVYSRTNNEDGSDVWETVSSDDGATWGEAFMAIEGGRHPTIATDLRDGGIVRAAYVAGALQATYQAAGDPSPSAPFVLRDETGAALSVQDDTFHLQPAYEGPSRWVLVVMIAGDTAPSDWVSADEGQTWERIA